MRSMMVMATVALAVTIGPLALVAQEDLADPYEILARHYDAVGGLAAFKAESTSYFEGTISVFGMEGTIKQWEYPPYRKRQELSLPVFSYTTGDNGEFAWVVDQNGKLQVQKDEKTIKKREVEALMSSYDYLDPESETFTLTYEGVDSVGVDDCYVVEIANNINETVRKVYVRKSDYYQAKSVVIEPDHEMHTLNSDFRDINGRMIPFHHEVEILPIGQSQTVQLTTYQPDIEIDRSMFEPPEEDADDFRFTEGNSAENIPFEYLGEHVYLDVTINCDKQRWLLDSGAAVTVIDSAFAAELGLETEGEAKAYGAGKTVTMAFAEVPAFSVAGIEFDSQRAAALPISGLLRKGGIEAVGILGYDFLSRFVTRIDFANREISFYHPDHFDYQGTGAVIDAPLENNLFQVPVTVEGKYSGIWMLDIGASGGGFRFPFTQEHGLLDRDGVEGLAGGAGGYFGIKASEFETVEIGGFQLRGQLLSMPLEEGGALSQRGGAGILGNNTLRHFVLYLDYGRQQVILEEGDDFTRDFPRGKSGLGLLVNDEGDFEALFVSPGTPADKAGFQSGDIVTAINGIAVEHLSGLLAVKDLFEADAGTEYVIGISRADQPMTLNLTLEDLF